MDGITVPHPLFQAIAGYLLPRAAYDPQAQGLYNEIIIALHKQTSAPADGGGHEEVEADEA